MSSTKKRSLSSRAGLQFPIRRIHKFLKKGYYAPRVGVGAPLVLAAVLEYLVIEILEISISVAKLNLKTRVSPRHLLFAIRNDEDLNRMLAGVTFARSGTFPFIHPQLLPHKTPKTVVKDSEKY